MCTLLQINLRCGGQRGALISVVTVQVDVKTRTNNDTKRFRSDASKSIWTEINITLINVKMQKTCIKDLLEKEIRNIHDSLKRRFMLQ